MSDDGGLPRCQWRVEADDQLCGQPAEDTVELPIHWADEDVLQPVPLCAEHLAEAQGRAGGSR